MRTIRTAGLLLAILAGPAGAQTLSGTWEGSSICTDRKIAPACRDEHVIYVFTPAAQGKVHLVADRVVDGVRSTMYEIDLAPDGAGGWFYRFDAPNGMTGRWQYGAPAAAKLEGELVDVRTGAQVRKVSVTRQ